MEAVETLVYTAQEAAKALKTDNGSFNKRLENGEIPAYKEGRYWKVPKSLLNRYIEEVAIKETEERRKVHQEKGAQV